MLEGLPRDAIIKDYDGKSIDQRRRGGLFCSEVEDSTLKQELELFFLARVTRADCGEQ